MNNRFKFRAGFTISFYDIAGNDAERQIILDSCFSIDNGGEGICVNEEIIQEALDIYVAKDEHKSAWDFINANYAETDGYYFIDSVDFLDQCTGLKDKNGQLIYENDLIKCPSGIYRIAVDDFGLWTAIYNNNPFEGVGEWSDMVKEYAFNQNNVEIEVLGNIHVNADLIKVGGK